MLIPVVIFLLKGQKVFDSGDDESFGNNQRFSEWMQIQSICLGASDLHPK